MSELIRISLIYRPLWVNLTKIRSWVQLETPTRSTYFFQNTALGWGRRGVGSLTKRIQSKVRAYRVQCRDRIVSKYSAEVGQLAWAA